MKFYPNFDQYYKEEWPYSAEQGVGIQLSGYPTNVYTFLDLLHQQGCSPVAARRILEELKEKNIKSTTLMSHLNFNYIGQFLSEIGVSLEIIAPANADKLKTHLLDKAAFNLAQHSGYNIDNFNVEDQQEIFRRKLIFEQSIAHKPHHLGPFDSNWTIAKQHMIIANKTKSRKKEKKNIN